MRQLETGYLAKLGDADALAEACGRCSSDASCGGGSRSASARSPSASSARDLEAARFVELYDTSSWPPRCAGSPALALRTSRRCWSGWRAPWHRGPDGRGVHRDGEVALVARRLAILDLRAASSRWPTTSGSLVIAFNGEIFNAPELRAELERDGVRFATDHSDTEVVLALWTSAAASSCRG